MSETVAVLTPIHNGEAHLPRYRRTLEAQSRPADEILVLDDGSTDSTPERLGQWAREDPRVRILAHSARMGRGASRRDLVEAADSTHVAWLDVDDRWHPEKLERQTAQFAAQRLDDATILCAPYLRLNDRTGDIRAINLPLSYRAEQYQRIGADALPPVMLQAAFGTREAFRVDGGFDPDLNWSEDFDFFLRFTKAGGEIRPQKSDTPLAFYFHTLLGRDPTQIEAAHRRLAEKHDGFWPDRAWRDREFRIRSLRYVFYAYVTNDHFEDGLRLIRDARAASPDDEVISDLLQRCEAFIGERLTARPDLYVPFRHERANRTKGFICTPTPDGYRFELKDEGGAEEFVFNAAKESEWRTTGPAAEISSELIDALFYRGVLSLEVTALGRRRSPKRTFPLIPLGPAIALVPN